MNTDLGKFKKAYRKLVALINDESLTWEQKNAKVFLEPTFVLEELKNTGLIDIKYQRPYSDRTEVLNLQLTCSKKLDYLQELEG